MLHARRGEWVLLDPAGRPEDTRAHRLVMDVVPALALLVFLCLVSPIAADKGQHGSLDPGAYALCVTASLAFVVRRKLPIVTYTVALASTFAYVITYGPGPIFVSAFGALIVLVVARPRPVWIPSAVFGALALAAAELMAEGASFGIAVFAGVWVGAAVLAGEAVRARKAEVAEMLARAELAERNREEEALRRVAEERLRIAREVHDVVGHGLATISLQAGVAEHLLASRPEEARTSVVAIRQVSRQALEELRAEIGALRRGADDAAPRAPTPGLDAVPRLVDSMREAGLDVRLERSGDGAALPTEVVQTAGYRIVQEALTNVARHAGSSAHARVVVKAGRSALEVEVVDDGPGTAGAELAEGNGIAGMRERAAALGGRFEAGQVNGGGFRVWARLPA